MTDSLPKIALAADHGGFALKQSIAEHLRGKATIIDLGTHSEDSVNYADYGHDTAQAVLSGKADKAIIVCGSGIGISIAANRHAGIRAALCTNATMARLARTHNDANILALGQRIIGREVALDCVDAFLSTPFEGGRHETRVKSLDRK
jgi:ribose 5-phosphate isomerase B